MQSPEFVKRMIAVGLAVGLGANALIGCSASIESHPSTSSTTATEITLAPTTTSTLETDVTLVAPGVAETHLGALQDEALNIGSDIPEYSIDEDEAALVADARQQIAALDDPQIRISANLNVDLRIAQAATSAADLSPYSDSDYILDGNKEKADAQETAIELIEDPVVKAEAERTLDLVEASKAVDAATYSVPNPKNAELLLGYVEDPTIKQQAIDAINQPDGKSDSADDIATHLSDANKAITDQGNIIFNALYNGSNMQAQNINGQIEAFNKARQAN